MQSRWCQPMVVVVMNSWYTIQLLGAQGPRASGFGADQFHLGLLGEASGDGSAVAQKFLCEGTPALQVLGLVRCVIG